MIAHPLGQKRTDKVTIGTCDYATGLPYRLCNPQADKVDLFFISQLFMMEIDTTQKTIEGAALLSDAPVVGSFQSNGKTVLTLCRRDLRSAIIDMELLTITPVSEQEGQSHAKAN